MKKITQIGCLWLCYLLTFSATAQNDESSDEFGKLNIGIVMPEELDGFTSIHLQKLETKILSLLNQSGIASRGGSSGIVMYPVISIFNEQQINPGIQTMTVIEGEISLFIKQVDDKFVFASHTRKIKGSGRTREQAVNNLISLLPNRSDEYGDFIKSAKTKVIDYYNKRCEMIVSKATQLSQANQHADAISLLFNVPSETRCFEKARGKALEVYRNYQNQICGQLVLQGKAKLEANLYQEGFDILAKVDPSSSCFKEVNTLFTKHGAEVDENVRRSWKLLEKIYANAFELEKYRWRAIGQWAIAYSSRPFVYERIIR